MKKNILIITLSITVAGPVFANCPSNLEADKLIECITIEGSDSNYQNWEKSYAITADTSLTDNTDVTVIMPATNSAH
ncbi:MAG: hypothetical protein OEY61_08840 [Gammaproteobacteria bacterium]|nr:hypothetical protein [Gammaproteobacteria bacterium]